MSGAISAVQCDVICAGMTATRLWVTSHTGQDLTTQPPPPPHQSMLQHQVTVSCNLSIYMDSSMWKTERWLFMLILFWLTAIFWPESWSIMNIIINVIYSRYQELNSMFMPGAGASRLLRDIAGSGLALQSLKPMSNTTQCMTHNYLFRQVIRKWYCQYLFISKYTRGLEMYNDCSMALACIWTVSLRQPGSLLISIVSSQ